MIRMLIVLAAAAGLAACSTTSPDVVQRGDAQKLSTVREAVVLSVRDVTVDGSQSGVGAATGGVVGGALGSTRGGGGGTTVAIATVGAVAGAVLGNVIERTATNEAAVELLLELRGGERVAIVQAKGQDSFQSGDAVLLVTSGGRTRVTKAPAGVPAAPVDAKPEPLPGKR